jgi:glycosyltransferase involved in cell wall biosynthesis
MVSDKKLAMGVILPHTKLFGGVKRFLELGRVFISRGHRFVIFTPAGITPDWYPGSCPVEKTSKLSDYELDALFLTQVEFLEDLLEANTGLKILYHIGPRVILHQVLKHKEIVVFANSSNMFELDKRKYGITPVKALGGIHIPELASPPREAGDPFTIMAYGRLSRKGKGTSLVVKACEKLFRKGYNVQLLLFDSPTDAVGVERIKKFTCKVPFEFVADHPVRENPALFSKADVFVAAERKGGWSNTAAEALASGVPLIGTATGTRDFLIHNETGLLVWRHPYFIRRAIEKLINDETLRKKLATNGRKKIAEFSWENLATFIESYVNSRRSA